MAAFLDLKDPLVESCLSILLKDKSTHGNIVFATNSYEELGESFHAEKPITRARLSKIDLRPRVLKSQNEQAERTRSKAEVFTPAWLCCKMNNHCDEEWFGRPNIFNHLKNEVWETIDTKIKFPKEKTWMAYVDSRRLEITCGEAPYIVSRYDASTGEPIEIKDRIGILDRKLRVVNENSRDRSEWLKWSIRSVQSVYGYEWQGDSLLIARINVLMTFIEYYRYCWGFNIDDEYLKAISTVSNVIAWNFWQMDGLTGTVPYGTLTEEHDMSSQPRLFEKEKEFSLIADNSENDDFVKCRIYDWRTKRSLEYRSIRRTRYEI